MKVAVLVSSMKNEGLQNVNSKRNLSPCNDAFEQYMYDAEFSKKSIQLDPKTTSNKQQTPKVNSEQKETSTPGDNTARVENNNDTTPKTELQNNNNSNSIPEASLEITEVPYNIANIELLDANIEPQIPSEIAALSEEVQVPVISIESNEELPLSTLDQVIVDNQNISKPLRNPENISELKKLVAEETDETDDNAQSAETPEVNESNVIIPATVLPTNLPSEVTLLPEEVATSLDTVVAEENNVPLIETASTRDATSQEKSSQPKEVVKMEAQAQTQTRNPLEESKVDMDLAQSQQKQAEAQKSDINPANTTNVIESAVTSRMAQPSKDTRAPESQPEKFSIIESIDIQPVASTGNDMSSDFNQQKENSLDADILEILNTKEAVESVEHGDAFMKVTDIKEAMAPIPSESSEDIESVANQIKTAVQNISNVNGKKITINLAPESLGRVEIEVTTEAGKIISIKIEVAKPETLALLEKNSQTLEDALKTVTGGDKSSLSFNLKEGNHGENNEQQQFAKNTPLSEPVMNKEEEVADGSSGAVTRRDVYNVSNNTTTTHVDMEI